ncbi:MAG: hypothetical protein Q4C41_05310 [Eggerthellaceae bacterium]|nr:hypothetical protein [Eggerthellaceae bacterium]
MAQKLDKAAYGALLRVREAWSFDLGCLLMRFYAYMMGVGTMAMITMAGYSFVEAGVTSSVIAISTFAVAPRVSKRIDERGQSKVVPLAAVVALAGLAVLLGTVYVGGPFWMLWVAAVPMGFLPNPQALARARWTTLIHSGRLGEKAPDLQTMFSYEGVIDDVGFMFGPAASVALATAVTPIAGMLAGGVVYVVGTAMLLAARSSEPAPSGAAGVAGRSLASAAGVADGASAQSRSIIRTSTVVAVLFVVMLFVGAFFSTYDAAVVALAQELGKPALASGVLMMISCLSMITGLLFGMMRLPFSPWARLMVTALLAGGTYGCMFLVNSEPTLIALSALSALFYAPLLITANATCEHAVETSRITEAITWINAGMTCGMALGSTLGGVVIDAWGAASGFDACAVMALCVPLVALFSRRMVK